MALTSASNAAATVRVIVENSMAFKKPMISEARG